MSIQGLGYVGVRAKSLADWAGFGENFLGMQLVDRSTKGLALRMDDRKQRLVVAEDGGEGVAFFGWEVADAAALDHFAARLEAAGVAVTRATRALADERHVKDLIAFSDPLGNRLELFHGAETASDVRQGDVGDGGVEHLHEGGERNRHGDDPALYRRIVIITKLDDGPSHLVHAPPGRDIWIVFTLAHRTKVRRVQTLRAALNFIRPVLVEGEAKTVRTKPKANYTKRPVT